MLLSQKKKIFWDISGFSKLQFSSSSLHRKGEKRIANLLIGYFGGGHCARGLSQYNRSVENQLSFVSSKGRETSKKYKHWGQQMIFHRDKLRKKAVPKEYFCHLISWQKNERRRLRGRHYYSISGKLLKSRPRIWKKWIWIELTIITFSAPPILSWGHTFRGAAALHSGQNT